MVIIVMNLIIYNIICFVKLNNLMEKLNTVFTILTKLLIYRQYKLLMVFIHIILYFIVYRMIILQWKI
jgi:hypothetical protein